MPQEAEPTIPSSSKNEPVRERGQVGEQRKLEWHSPLLIFSQQRSSSAAGWSSHQERGESSASSLPSMSSDASFTGVHLLAAVATQDEWTRSEGVGPEFSPTSSTQSLESEEEDPRQTDESDEPDPYIEEEELE